MKKIWYVVPVLFVVMMLLAPTAKTADVVRITKEELKAKLCSPNLILIDVRVSQGWEKSTQEIKCAKRMDPNNVSAWADSLPKDKEIVLYCSWKAEHTSARVAQELMAKGFTNVKALKGGWNEWADNKYPLENK